MSYVDFKEVKELATLDQVAAWLGLKLVHNRAQCPVNEGDKRELVLTPDKGLWRCFGCKKGGDQIELAAHVGQVSQKEAALAIQEHFRGYRPAERPKLPAGGLEYLEAEHDAVQALGLTAEAAHCLGIGFARKGTMAGRVLFPLRDPKGRLLGYIGYHPDKPLKLPSNLEPS